MKLDVIWGQEIGGMRPVQSLVSRIQLLICEYISSGDIEEATRCLNELEVPHLHHHLIYEGIIKALEDMNERTLKLIAELFEYLYKTVVVTVDQLTIGFNQVYEELEEISIDVPLAYPILEKLGKLRIIYFHLKFNPNFILFFLVKSVAKCESFLPKDLVKNCPKQQRGRKRVLSENSGRFKEEY